MNLSPTSPPVTLTYNLHPSQISGDEFFSDVAKGILQYVTRNLSHRVRVSTEAGIPGCRRA